MFRSTSFKNCFCSFILHFSGLITIRFFPDPALNLYFDLTIRGTDTVSIYWALQVLLSFKWIEQKSSLQLFENWLTSQMERSVLVMLSDRSSTRLCWGAGHQHEIA